MKNVVLGKTGTGKTVYLQNVVATDKKNIVIVDAFGEYKKLLPLFEGRGYKIWKEDTKKDMELNLPFGEKTVFYYEGLSNRYGLPVRLESWLQKLSSEPDTIVIVDGISPFKSISSLEGLKSSIDLILQPNFKGDVHISSQSICSKIEGLLSQDQSVEITAFCLGDKDLKKLMDYGLTEEESYKLQRLSQYHYASLVTENQKITITMEDGTWMLTEKGLQLLK